MIQPLVYNEFWILEVLQVKDTSLTLINLTVCGW